MGQDIGRYVKDCKLSHAFIADLRATKHVVDGLVCLKVGSQSVELPGLSETDYDAFWRSYRRPPDVEVLDLILAQRDVLDEIVERRYEGAFYTPPAVAEKCHQYLESAMPNWQNDPNVRVWDMCSGTGNLEQGMVNFRNCWFSTIDEGDVQYLRMRCPNARGCFQYNYLADDIKIIFGKGKGRNPTTKDKLLDDSLGWKLPRALREDLANPDIKWVVLINPPYGEAGPGVGKGHTHKNGITTAYSELISALDIGKAGNELFNLFIGRIATELPNCILGMLSTSKFINYENSAPLRDKLFRPASLRGFCFPSKLFEGIKGDFPILFSTWLLSAKRKKIEMTADIYNMQMEKIGEKVFKEDERKLLSAWLARPRLTTPCLPISLAGMPPREVKVRVDKTALNAVGALEFHSSDVQQNKVTTCTSNPNFQMNGFAITEDMLPKAFMMWAARRLVQDYWLNHMDIYRVPDESKIPSWFAGSCATFCLWHASNKTTALEGIEYDGRTWDVRNNFVAYDPSKIKPKDITVFNMLKRMKTGPVYNWLQQQEQHPACAAVTAAGTEIVKLFWDNYGTLDLGADNVRIASADAGFCQMTAALAACGHTKDRYEQLRSELLSALSELRAILVPVVYDSGMLEPERLLEQEETES